MHLSAHNSNIVVRCYKRQWQGFLITCSLEVILSHRYKLQAHLILLQFAVLYSVDAVIFTDWRFVNLHQARLSTSFSNICSLRSCLSYFGNSHIISNICSSDLESVVLDITIVIVLGYCEPISTACYKEIVNGFNKLHCCLF